MRIRKTRGVNHGPEAELQHCYPTAPLYKAVGPLMGCRDPWPCVSEELSVLDDEREKRRSSSYEINPAPYKNHSSPV